MDGVSVFTAIDKLHATPNSGKKKFNFFPHDHYQVCYS